MAQTAAQIVQLATQIAKCPSYLTQAGQYLNMALQSLALTNDFEVCLRRATIVLSPSPGDGPYPLPSDYLRMQADEVQYVFGGMPVTMINVPVADLDALQKLPVTAAYPTVFSTDLSGGQGNSVLNVWGPPSGQINLDVRYFSLPPDIVTPETSSVVPWFPFSDYLVARVAGDMMRLSGDNRAPLFLGDNPMGAEGMLRKFLSLQNDTEGRAMTVRLDPRFFGAGGGSLPPSKVYPFG